MPISVRYLQFKGFAIAPNDASLGEAESQKISILKNGRPIELSIFRRSLEVKIKGVTTADAIPFISAAKANTLGLILGGAEIEDIVIGAHTIRQAVLVKATASVPILVQNMEILEELKLEYQSLIYET